MPPAPLPPGYMQTPAIPPPYHRPGSIAPQDFRTPSVPPGGAYQQPGHARPPSTSNNPPGPPNSGWQQHPPPPQQQQQQQQQQQWQQGPPPPPSAGGGPPGPAVGYAPGRYGVMPPPIRQDTIMGQPPGQHYPQQHPPQPQQVQQQHQPQQYGVTQGGQVMGGPPMRTNMTPRPEGYPPNDPNNMGQPPPPYQYQQIQQATPPPVRPGSTVYGHGYSGSTGMGGPLPGPPPPQIQQQRPGSVVYQGGYYAPPSQPGQQPYQQPPPSQPVNPQYAQSAYNHPPPAPSGQQQVNPQGQGVATGPPPPLPFMPPGYQEDGQHHMQGQPPRPPMPNQGQTHLYDAQHPPQQAIPGQQPQPQQYQVQQQPPADGPHAAQWQGHPQQFQGNTGAPHMQQTQAGAYQPPPTQHPDPYAQPGHAQQQQYAPPAGPPGAVAMAPRPPSQSGPGMPPPAGEPGGAGHPPAGNYIPPPTGPPPQYSNPPPVSSRPPPPPGAPPGPSQEPRPYPPPASSPHHPPPYPPPATQHKPPHGPPPPVQYGATNSAVASGFQQPPPSTTGGVWPQSSQVQPLPLGPVATQPPPGHPPQANVPSNVLSGIATANNAPPTQHPQHAAHQSVAISPEQPMTQPYPQGGPPPPSHAPGASHPVASVGRADETTVSPVSMYREPATTAPPNDTELVQAPLPIRTTTFTTPGIGASALGGIGGPSDWEHFGMSAEDEGLDDTEEIANMSPSNAKDPKKQASSREETTELPSTTSPLHVKSDESNATVTAPAPSHPQSRRTSSISGGVESNTKPSPGSSRYAPTPPPKGAPTINYSPGRPDSIISLEEPISLRERPSIDSGSIISGPRVAPPPAAHSFVVDDGSATPVVHRRDTLKALPPTPPTAEPEEPAESKAPPAAAATSFMVDDGSSTILPPAGESFVMDDGGAAGVPPAAAPTSFAIDDGGAPAAPPAASQSFAIDDGGFAPPVEEPRRVKPAPEGAAPPKKPKKRVSRKAVPNSPQTSVDDYTTSTPSTTKKQKAKTPTVDSIGEESARSVVVDGGAVDATSTVTTREPPPVASHSFVMDDGSSMIPPGATHPVVVADALIAPPVRRSPSSHSPERSPSSHPPHLSSFNDRGDQTQDFPYEDRGQQTDADLDDPHPDLHPWFKNSLARYNEMLHQECHAETDADRTRLFTDFMMKESRLRGVRYGAAVGSRNESEDAPGDTADRRSRQDSSAAAVDAERDRSRSQHSATSRQVEVQPAVKPEPNAQAQLEAARNRSNSHQQTSRAVEPDQAAKPPPLVTSHSSSSAVVEEPEDVEYSPGGRPRARAKNEPSGAAPAATSRAEQTPPTHITLPPQQMPLAGPTDTLPINTDGSVTISPNSMSSERKSIVATPSSETVSSQNSPTPPTSGYKPFRPGVPGSYKPYTPPTEEPPSAAARRQTMLIAPANTRPETPSYKNVADRRASADSSLLLKAGKAPGSGSPRLNSAAGQGGINNLPSLAEGVEPVIGVERKRSQTASAGSVLNPGPHPEKNMAPPRPQPFDLVGIPGARPISSMGNRGPRPTSVIDGVGPRPNGAEESSQSPSDDVSGVPIPRPLNTKPRPTSVFGSPQSRPNDAGAAAPHGLRPIALTDGPIPRPLSVAGPPGPSGLTSSPPSDAPAPSNPSLVAGLTHILPSNREMMVVESSQAIIAIEEAVTTMPSNVKEINRLYGEWEKKAKAVRTENDTLRRKRQETQEEETDRLFSDSQIGYGDISAIEDDFRNAEAQRKTAEDTAEYDSFVEGVFGPTYNMIQSEIAFLMNQRAAVHEELGRGVVGKEELETHPDRVELVAALNAFILIHERIEFRHQKVLEAVVDRDRRYKRTVTAPLYAAGNIIEMKRMEGHFEEAERKALLKATQEKEERMGQVLQTIDEATRRGLERDLGYLEAIGGEIGQITASLPPSIPKDRTNEVDLLLEELKVVPAVLERLRVTAERLMGSAHTAALGVNGVKHEALIGAAKLEGAGAEAIDQIVVEKQREDERLLGEFERGVARVRDDHRAANERVVPLVPKLKELKFTATDPALAGGVVTDPEHQDRVRKALEAAKRRNAVMQGGQGAEEDFS